MTDAACHRAKSADQTALERLTRRKEQWLHGCLAGRDRANMIL